MANIKFSAFTNEAVDAATTQLVGYKVGDTSANYRYSIAQLATAIPSIYSADGSIATGVNRTLTLDGTGTLKIAGAGAAGDFMIKNAGNDADAYTVYMTDGTGQANVGAYGGINFISRYGSIGSTANYNNLGVWTFERNVVIKGQAYTELHDTANTTLTVDWDDSNIQELTGLTGSHTFTASNPKAGATYILTLAQTGAVTATWTGVKWPGGTAPTLSGTGKTDVVTLICYDATGAGLYYGSATLDLA